MLIWELFLVALPLLLPAFDALSSVYSNAAGYSNSVAYSSSNYGPPGTGYGYSARSSLVRWENQIKNSGDFTLIFFRLSSPTNKKRYIQKSRSCGPKLRNFRRRNIISGVRSTTVALTTTRQTPTTWSSPTLTRLSTDRRTQSKLGSNTFDQLSTFRAKFLETGERTKDHSNWLDWTAEVRDRHRDLTRNNQASVLRRKWRQELDRDWTNMKTNEKYNK